MLNWGSNTLRRLLHETSGSDIVEAAFVLPLLFMVIIGIFWFGQAYRIYNTETHAAMEGARAAVAPACTTCAPLTTTQIDTNAVTAVNNSLAAAHLSPAQLQPSGSTWNPPTLCSCGSTSATCTGGAAVSCDASVSGSNVCVQRNVQLSYTTISGAAGSCGTSVSFGYQYPVHFTLPCWPQPCTSFDLSKMTLTAQAQMRVETQ
jgi:Flp pilus assembly protein TadG